MPPLTAQDVVDAFEKAGLALPNLRDSSSECGDVGCAQMMATDLMTILSFEDEFDAKKYVRTATGDRMAKDNIVILYTADIPAEQRSRYEDEVVRVADEHYW